MILDKENVELLLQLRLESGKIIGRNHIKKVLGCSDTIARAYGAVIDNIHIFEGSKTDKDIIASNVKLAKQKQRHMDVNRVANKSFREDVRIENAVEAYAEAIVEQNRAFGKELCKIKVPKISKSSKAVGVIQLSDAHANELINLPHNQYDFTVFSDRLKKLADEAIRIFKAYEITDVLIAATGDMLNSSRRLDELLNQATNRSKASVLTQYVLTQFILHIRQHFRLSIVSVLGNESRMDKEWHSANNVVSDNYDYTIFANIKQKFEFANIEDITFGSIDTMEQVVDVNGQNWLLRHDVPKATDKQKDIQSVIGKYSLQGDPIEFIIAGHIHSTRNTDLSARSASIAGSNEYNEHALGLLGRASQNIFVVTKDSRYSISIDLQNTKKCSGYDIIHELEAYNAKSHDKASVSTPIFKVVI